jgi:hypothetical protein
MQVSFVSSATTQLPTSIPINVCFQEVYVRSVGPRNFNAKPAKASPAV